MYHNSKTTKKPATSSTEGHIAVDLHLIEVVLVEKYAHLLLSRMFVIYTDI